ncbi:MAG: hypothetical protein IKS31_08180 [Clostridia bacterium]|nr:hypothetical protein [Clostridia bacterium]
MLADRLRRFRLPLLIAAVLALLSLCAASPAEDAGADFTVEAADGSGTALRVSGETGEAVLLRDGEEAGDCTREIAGDGWDLYLFENETALLLDRGTQTLTRCTLAAEANRWRVYRDDALDTALLEVLRTSGFQDDTGWQGACLGDPENPGCRRVLMLNKESGRMAAYELAAQNGPWAMYFCAPSLSALLQQRETGQTLCSTLPAGAISKNVKNESDIKRQSFSGVTMQVRHSKNTQSTEAVDLYNTECEVTCKLVDGGVSAHVHFGGKYDIALTVEVTLGNGELLVRIPDDSIEERNETYSIYWIDVFPMMGATRPNAKGYLFVPDGGGGLISMDDKHGRFQTGYMGPVYGRDSGFRESSVKTLLYERYEALNDAYTALIPVFGTARTDIGLGYVAVIESDDTRCRVMASPNGVLDFPYNMIYPSFYIREAYQQKTTGTTMLEEDRNHRDIAVRYCLLTGDDANYTGMAVRYRTYLLEKGGLQQRDTAYRTRVDFLGTERESFLVGTRAVPMTSADEARQIIADLRGSGVTTLFSAFKGWQDGGLYALPVSSFRTDAAVGDLGALIREEASAGALICPYVDALRMNAATNTFTHDVAKMHSKNDIREELRKPVYTTFYYMIPSSSADRLRSLADSLRQNNLPALAVSGITGKLFSFSAKEVFYGRADCADTYREALRGAADGISIAMEMPNAYLWSSMSAFLDLPMSTSGYQYIDAEVPFLALVLKGVVPTYSEYVNFEANKQEFFLRLVETGTYPSFYVTQENSSALIYTNSNDLYSIRFSSHRDTIIEYDKALRSLNALTEGAVITGHEIDGDLRIVTYSNGLRIYVNYGSESAVSADGVTVEAMNYTWREGARQ